MTSLPVARVGEGRGYRNATREIVRGGLAGLATGFVMGGGGGRLAMRIAALLDPSARGITTEAGATVGEFTLEGTVGLVFFGGIFTGIGLAVIWVVVRPWLPGRGAARFLVAGVVGVAMGGRFAIDGRNFDFFILDPAWAQAAIFIVLAAVTGMAVVVVDGWLEQRLPPPRTELMIGYGIVAALGLLLAIPSLLLYFRTEDCACVSPPRLVGVLLIGLVVVTARSWVSGDAGSGSSHWMARAGPILLVALVAAGLLHLGGEIAHFT